VICKEERLFAVFYPQKAGTFIMHNAQKLLAILYTKLEKALESDVKTWYIVHVIRRQRDTPYGNRERISPGQIEKEAPP
jgi:hypothetical protein